MSNFKESVKEIFAQVFGRADFKEVLEDTWDFEDESGTGNTVEDQEPKSPKERRKTSSTLPMEAQRTDGDGPAPAKRHPAVHDGIEANPESHNLADVSLPEAAEDTFPPPANWSNSGFSAFGRPGPTDDDLQTLDEDLLPSAADAETGPLRLTKGTQRAPKHPDKDEGLLPDALEEGPGLGETDVCDEEIGLETGIAPPVHATQEILALGSDEEEGLAPPSPPGPLLLTDPEGAAKPKTEEPEQVANPEAPAMGRPGDQEAAKKPHLGSGATDSVATVLADRDEVRTVDDTATGDLGAEAEANDGRTSEDYEQDRVDTTSTPPVDGALTAASPVRTAAQKSPDAPEPVAEVQPEPPPAAAPAPQPPAAPPPAENPPLEPSDSGSSLLFSDRRIVEELLENPGDTASGLETEDEEDLTLPAMSLTDLGLTPVSAEDGADAVGQTLETSIDEFLSANSGPASEVWEADAVETSVGGLSPEEGEAEAEETWSDERSTQGVLPPVRKPRRSSLARGQPDATSTSIGPIKPPPSPTGLPYDEGVGPASSTLWKQDRVRSELLDGIRAEMEAFLEEEDDEVIQLLLRALRSEDIDIPPFPPTAQALLGADGRPPSDEEVLAVVRSDPALAGNIVKVANSPFYGSAAPVASLDSAVMRIGLRQIRHIALATVLGATFSVKGFDDVCQQFRIHSMAVGLAAETMAPTFNLPTGQAFLSGLLHDAGEILAYQLVFRIHSNMGTEDDPWPPRPAFMGALARRHHPRLGALFFEAWDLPGSVASAMAYHHQPDAAEPAFQPLCRLIWAANALSTIALDHGRTKIWQASVEARSEAYGNAELAQINEEDGINALDLSDILEYLGGRADVHLLRKVIRTLLLRVEMAVAISVVPSRG